jgi:endonuclease-3
VEDKEGAMGRVEKIQKALAIYQSLNNFYGQPAWQGRNDPVDELILTILSANTNDINSGRAFAQLKAAFGEAWDNVRTAPLEAIKTAIRPAGMYHQKAPHIVATLEKLHQAPHGYNLDHLATMPVTDALAYLMTFPGVGHKTASIVLLFCFNRGAFPVDTHVQRISQRLGVSGKNASTIQIKTLWETLLPPESYFALHVNLIQHGRRICLARSPHCMDCPLQSLCDYHNHTNQWA